MARGTGIPVSGTDATGADAYATIIAAPTAPLFYTHLQAICATNDAILSVDGGTTDSFVVKAGADPIPIPGLQIREAIQAKNRTGSSNYANLFVSVWTENL